VTVERCRVELGQYKYLVEATVDAVAHWDVYKPVTSSNRNLQKQTCFIISSQHGSGTPRK